MLIRANARQIPLKDKTVQCCVTSPPYWGLRDYGDQNQIGLEPTPEEYVRSILEVAREIWRVLKDNGTLWLNLGDSYATGAGKVGDCPGGGAQGDKWKGYRGTRQDGKHKYISENMGPMIQPNRMPLPGLKPKDLCMIPARVALALQSDGWYLRSDIIWSKPNPMPESVRDRPTKAHEYIFLLSKSERYCFNQDAVKEPSTYSAPNAPDKIKSPYGQGFTRNASWKGSEFHDGKNLENHPSVGRKRESGLVHGNLPGRSDNGAACNKPDQTYRNIRSVWQISTTPYSGAHFATFPREIPERCIKAGSKPGDVILDPFCGSGTTVMVAQDLGRVGIGIDLKYQKLAAERIGGSLFAGCVNQAFDSPVQEQLCASQPS